MFRDFVYENSVLLLTIILFILILTLVAIILVLLFKNKLILIYNLKSNFVTNSDVANEKLSYLIDLKKEKDYYYYIINDVDGKNLGKSREYRTKLGCLNSLLSFNKLSTYKVVNNIKNDYKKSFGEKFIEIVYENDVYLYRIKNSNNGISFKSIKYKTLEECTKELDFIRNNYNINYLGS